jgi:hypothetical protein
VFGPRDPDAEDARTPSAPPRAIAAPSEDGDASGPGFGEDLRRLRKSDRRPLDLEDPFQ